MSNIPEEISMTSGGRKHSFLSLLAAATPFLIMAPAWVAPAFWDEHVLQAASRHATMLESLTVPLLGLYWRPLGTLVWKLSSCFGAFQVGAVRALSSVLVIFSGALLASKRRDRGLTVFLLLAANPIAVVTGSWGANLFSAGSMAMGLISLELARVGKPLASLLSLLLACLFKEDGVAFVMGALAGSRRASSKAGAAALLLGYFLSRTLIGDVSVIAIPHLESLLPKPVAAIAVAAVLVAAGKLLGNVLRRFPPPVKDNSELIATAIASVSMAALALTVSPIDQHWLWLRFFLIPATLLLLAVPQRWVFPLAICLAIPASLLWQLSWLEALSASREEVLTASSCPKNQICRGEEYVEMAVTVAARLLNPSCGVTIRTYGWSWVSGTHKEVEALTKIVSPVPFPQNPTCLSDDFCVALVKPPPISVWMSTQEKLREKGSSRK